MLLSNDPQYGHSNTEAPKDQLTFETGHAETYTKALAEPITETYFDKILQYWESQGLIKLDA